MNEPETHSKQINEVLAGRADLRKLKPFFLSWENVLQFYAQQMSEKFPASANPTECQICRRAVPAVKMAYDWRARYDTRETIVSNAVLTTLLLAVGHLHYETKIIDFRTHHRFCVRCSRRLFWRQRAASFITNSCTVVLCIAFLVLICTAAVLGYFLHISAARWEILGAGNVALISLGLCVLAFLGLRFFRARMLPEELVGLGKSPFDCVRRTRE